MHVSSHTLDANKREAQQCNITMDSFPRLEKQDQSKKQVFKEPGESCPRAGKRREPGGFAYGDLIGYVSDPGSVA